jgi:hypothetical protein
MGTYFKIANPAKRQYLSPQDFASSGKNKWFLTEHLGVAVTLLVGGPRSPLGHTRDGAWHGDAVIFAGDNDPPNAGGIITATPDQPNRNLYALCSQEYENLALSALAMVLNWREDAAEQLVRIGMADSIIGPRLLTNLRALTDWRGAGAEIDTERLEHALEAGLGPGWRDRLERLGR